MIKFINCKRNGKFCYFTEIRKSGNNIKKTEAPEMRVLMSVAAVAVRRLIRTKNLEKYRLVRNSKSLLKCRPLHTQIKSNKASLTEFSCRNIVRKFNTWLHDVNTCFRCLVCCSQFTQTESYSWRFCTDILCEYIKCCYSQF